MCQRRNLGRFENCRIAARNGCCNSPHRKQERRIPGRDGQLDTKRFFDRHNQTAPVQLTWLNDALGGLQDMAGQFLKLVDGDPDVEVFDKVIHWRFGLHKWSTKHSQEAGGLFSYL